VRRRFDLFGYCLVALALGCVQLLLDRGNYVDWFASAESWIYAIIAASASWVGVIHLATAREPLFNRHLFADANYVFALFFTMIVGLVMFATMALLPPMLQRLFGYGVIDTGMAMMPRGVGTLISMQISGWLLRRGHDPRVMMATGFVIAAFSLWQMAGWSLDTDYARVATAGFTQGIGIGMVFIPLNASAFATLSSAMRTDGASLLNLMRSIGSSVGISVVTTLLGRNLQVSHSDLASHVTASFSTLFDISTLDRFQQIGDAAFQLIDGEVNRQAAMIAYINDYALMMWLSILTVPFIALMRRADLSTAGRLASARREGEAEAPPADLPH
jgi:DHA2 family multidrug resistance protein